MDASGSPIPGLSSRPGFVLGTMGLTGYYGPVDRDLAVATLHRYLDRGGVLIDTADLYADGANEVLVGEALRARPGAALIATKVGYTFGARADQRGLDARPERIAAACEASLKRLGVEAIDLYYLHRVDPKVPVEDTWGAMARLVTEGKVRALGMCEVGPQTLQRAAAIHPVAVVQSEYSLWSREPENGLLSLLAEQGTWFFGYASLGRGFMSGAIRSPADFSPDDQRRDMPRFQGENFQRNLDLVDAMAHVAKARGLTPAELAIAWCRRQGLVVPIVGATRPEHVDEAFSGAELSLPEQVWAGLDAVFPVGAAAGERYSAAAMQRLAASR